MGLLRYTPLSIGGAVHPSSSSRPLPLPPSKFSSCKFRGWHMTSSPIKASRCALDKSVAGATNNSSQVAAPTLTGIEDEWEVTKLAADIDPESITEWELDFCSRPILDIRGKKIWELVVCDSKRALEFTRFYPNNVINSITLKDAIMSIVQTLGVPKPQTIRFFRSQMKTIVSKACNELGIRPVPSKRCLSLIRWLEERYEPVYMRHPGFQKGAKALLTLEQSSPLELPDNLCGEKWAFVQLPLAVVQEELAIVQEESSFGSVLDLDILGISLSDDALIPGVAIASSRAIGLAGEEGSLNGEMSREA